MLAAPPVTGDTRTVSTTVSSHRRSRLVPARVIGSAMFYAAVERRNQLARQDDEADMLTPASRLQAWPVLPLTSCPTFGF